MGWIIFGFVIVFILLLLMIPVHVIIDYNNSLTILIRFLCFKKKIVPNQSSEKVQNSEEIKEVQKNKSKKHKNKKHSFSDTIPVVISALKSLDKSIIVIIKNICIYEIKGYWKVTGDDAADCAIKYGRICAGFGSTYALLNNIKKIDKLYFRIYPDFTLNSDTICFYLNIKFNPLIILWGLLLFAIYLIKNMISVKRNNIYHNNNTKEIKKECA